jgi:hypothetical protein
MISEGGAEMKRGAVAMLAVVMLLVAVVGALALDLLVSHGHIEVLETLGTWEA